MTHSAKVNPVIRYSASTEIEPVVLHLTPVLSYVRGKRGLEEPTSCKIELMIKHRMSIDFITI